MKKIGTTITAILLLLASAACAHAGDGIADFTRIFNTDPEYCAIKEKIEKTAQEKQNNDLSGSEKTVLSADEILTEIEAKVQLAEQQEEDKKKLAQIRQEILGIISAVAAEKGLDGVYDTTAMLEAGYKTSNMPDLTEDIIARVNRRNDNPGVMTDTPEPEPAPQPAAAVKPAQTAANTSMPAKDRATVQVAASRDKKACARLIEQLKKAGYTNTAILTVQNTGLKYRVRVYSDSTPAQELAQQLKVKGFSCYIPK